MLELRDDPLIDLPRSEARHGLGLFETILVKGGRPLWLNWHLERLSEGTRFLRMDAPPPEVELLRRAESRFELARVREGVLRLYAVDGAIGMDLARNLPPRPAVGSAALSRRTRRLSGSPQCRFKTFSYIESVLLTREASERGLSEAIALNENGRLTDGGTTNLFVILDGRLLTPPAAEGALPGTARRLLLESGLAAEASLAPAELGRAEAAFLTNALRLVFPLENLEGRALDPAHPLIREAASLFAF